MHYGVYAQKYARTRNAARLPPTTGPSSWRTCSVHTTQPMTRHSAAILLHGATPQASGHAERCSQCKNEPILLLRGPRHRGHELPWAESHAWNMCSTAMDPLRVVTMHEFFFEHSHIFVHQAWKGRRAPHTDPTDTLRVVYRRPWTTNSNNGPIPVDYVP